MSVLSDKDKIKIDFDNTIEKLALIDKIQNLLKEKGRITFDLDKINIVSFEKKNDKHPKCLYTLKLIKSKDGNLNYYLDVNFSPERIFAKDTIISSKEISDDYIDFINLIKATMIYFNNTENEAEIVSLITSGA